jgi:hypothetical protein
MGDVAQFKAAIDKFQEAVRGTGLDLQKRAVAEVFTGLVQENPVGNPSLWKRPARKGYVGGTSRRAWTIDVGGGAGGGLGVLGSVKLGDRVRVSNPVEYMDALNRGHSRQAPAGWIEAVVERVTAKYRGGAV